MSGSPDSRNPGFVLVSVLLVVTLLVGGATGYAWFARNQMKFIDREKYDLMARGLSYAAVLQVAKGLQYDDNSYDSYLEPWFRTQIIPVDGMGLLIINIVPLESKIPLNELFLPDSETLRSEIVYTWEELWKIYENPGTGAIILDFIDKNTRPRLGSREEDYFPNRKLVDISEITLIEDLPEEIFNPLPMVPSLQDLVSVWSSGKININIASFAVLTLIDGIDEIAAREIIETRQDDPFESIEDLSGRVPSINPGAIPRIMNLVGFQSNYFAVKVEVRSLVDGYSSYFTAILKRNGSGCRIEKWEEN